MDAHVVVVAHEFGDDCLEFAGRLILRVPQTLALEGSELAFHEHVIPPPGLAVHALSYALTLEELDVVVRPEGRALVGAKPISS